MMFLAVYTHQIEASNVDNTSSTYDKNEQGFSTLCDVFLTKNIGGRIILRHAKGGGRFYIKRPYIEITSEHFLKFNFMLFWVRIHDSDTFQIKF